VWCGQGDMHVVFVTYLTTFQYTKLFPISRGKRECGNFEGKIKAGCEYEKMMYFFVVKKKGGILEYLICCMLLLLDASFEPGTSWLKIFNQEATMETSEKI
jgi:hypothetical protein